MHRLPCSTIAAVQHDLRRVRRRHALHLALTELGRVALDEAGRGQFKVTAGESGVVRLRFTASGGTVRVDDVYVDPRYRG